MQILVATDGELDPQKVTDAVARWYEEGDSVLVFTAVNVPTEFLLRLGDSGVKAASSIALEAGQGFTAGDRAAERLAQAHPVQQAPPRDSPVARAMASTATARTKPIVEALRGRGIQAKSTWATTENKTARSILTAVRQHDVELVIIGSHGHGRYEGMLGSTGTKVVRQSPVSVFVIRSNFTA